ncbi:MAG: tRNA pseudouridine(54/55) synthase Pus10 [Candidatus Bathyarchaeota archaeon]
MGIIEIINSLLKDYAFCDSCLGRQFAMLGHGLTNEERGRALKLTCLIEGSRLEGEERNKGRKVIHFLAVNGFSQIASGTLESWGFKNEKQKKDCYLCHGVFTHIEELAVFVTKKLSQYEYNSFLVGIKCNAEVEDREDELRSKFGLKWGESIRNELSREIGKKLVEITKKNVDLRRPDIVIVLNPFKKSIGLEVNSLFLAGRYRKLVRGVSQSKWFCRECRGKGCPRCNMTGKMYPDSVEELIGSPLLEVTRGECAKLHAAGREDIDVRMLGSGRPFVIEAKKPETRAIDLEELRKVINMKAEGKIEVDTLRFSSKGEVRKLKEGEKAIKVYRAVVAVDRDLDENDIKKIEQMTGTIINQMTPIRVSHRRALKIRKKYLYGIEVKKLKVNLIEILIRCQGGLYVKELIHGDEGRTKPSISEVIDVSSKCLELDVMNIEMEEF